MTRIEGSLQNSTWLLSEDDPEFADHGRPEFFPAICGPPLKVLERPEPTGCHQLTDVRRSRARFRRHPGWPGTVTCSAALVREPVQSEMGREPLPRLGASLAYRATLAHVPIMLVRVGRS